MKHPVEGERGKRYVGLPEFARAVEGLLSQLGIEQNRGTVSLVPDERTIRYYLSEGLIQPAEEKQGTASVFIYRHLLQLVAVKKLQAEHLPIKKIRELVSGKDDQQLESLLGVTSAPRKKSDETEAKRYLESLLTPSMSLSSPPTLFAASARKMQWSAPQAPAQVDQKASWQRVEIEPGLELHIRSDYALPATGTRTKNLLDRIVSKLRRLRRVED